MVLINLMPEHLTTLTTKDSIEHCMGIFVFSDTMMHFPDSVVSARLLPRSWFIVSGVFELGLQYLGEGGSVFVWTAFLLVCDGHVGGWEWLGVLEGSADFALYSLREGNRCLFANMEYTALLALDSFVFCESRLRIITKKRS